MGFTYHRGRTPRPAGGATAVQKELRNGREVFSGLSPQSKFSAESAQPRRSTSPQGQTFEPVSRGSNHRRVLEPSVARRRCGRRGARPENAPGTRETQRPEGGGGIGSESERRRVRSGVATCAHKASRSRETRRGSADAVPRGTLVLSAASITKRPRHRFSKTSDFFRSRPMSGLTFRPLQIKPVPRRRKA